ncbi:phage terminase small subunit [Achromobacter sp. UMC71]|uniref:phage terminase small subunit n=1 Tax=Achromobacter sp. UMC71 TaxID=1862320 RepID=UPI001603A3D2|nr:phage terminase small subunit [Achromobacter sp. UMC71]MBB1625172.1 hypothetical protein [Achromobacter sp. UMC71]
MPSPAQRHRMTVLAATAASAYHSAEPSPAAGVYGLMMSALVDDMRRLKDIQSLERKISAKAEMLPKYRDYLDGVLAADAGGQDEIVTTLMVWHLDVCELARGLELAGYVIKHGLALPERYNRTVGTLLLDEVGDAVLAGRVPHDVTTLGALQMLAVLVEGQDAPDQARAKLHRAMGDTLAALAGPDPIGQRLEMVRAALAQLKRAVSLHDKVGAKKDIEQLERTIKKAEATAAG